MEVLHAYNGCYPFGQRKDSSSTYVELKKENMTEEDIHLYKQMTRIYKHLNNPHFIRLKKMLREDDRLYFIYQYEEISITAYVEAIRQNFQGSFTKDKYKSLLIEFKNNIDNIIDGLIKQEIKTDVLLSNLACVRKQQDEDGFMLKVFVDMDAEYLSLIDHSYRPKDSKKKDRSSLNQEYLFQFYEAERKRLMLDFEELVQTIFGSVQETADKKQFPNFIIQGTKLVFVHSEEKLRDNSYQNVGESKKNICRDKLGNRSADSDKRSGDSFHMISKQVRTKQREPVPSYEECQSLQRKKGHPQTPIIDFDQSFEPEFRPEQFTKQKTYIYEEGDYLDSLEEEIVKLHQEKRGIEDKKTNKSGDEKRFNPNSFNYNQQKNQGKKFSLDRQRKESKQSSPMAQHSDKYRHQEGTKQKDQISQGSTQSNPNNYSGNRSKDNISNSDSYEKKEKQGHKMNKYKMKIITSHQIEIEGGEEPNVEEIEKQIIEGIRTGKININELNNKQKFTVLQKQQNQVKKQLPQMYKSDHSQQRNSFDGEKMINSDHKPAEEIKQPFVKTKQIPLNKMKNVHEIIQKLGIKPKTAQEGQKSQQLPRVEPKKQVSYLQSVTTPKPQNIEPFEKPERTTYPQKLSYRDKESPNRNEEKPPCHEQEDPTRKSDRAEKYYSKIQQAKSKAEQVLREYGARKKN